MDLQNRAILHQKVGFLHFILPQTEVISMEQHKEYLNTLCRVCGRYFGSQRNREPAYQCLQYSSELLRVFEINIAEDLDTVHPSNFCKPCRIVVHTFMKAFNEGTVYKHSIVIFNGWGPHLDDRCSTCEHVKSLQLGGRPKRKAGPGRPSMKDVNTLISHLECIAPYPLVPYTSTMPTALDKQLSVNAECPLCLMLLNSPIELINCGAVVCFQCVCSWLKTSVTLSCPCCYEQPLSVSMVRPASNCVQDVVRKISVICPICARTLELGHYEHHWNSSCSYLPIESVIEGILLQPESAPLSSIESALQANLVRRSLSMSPDKDVMVVKSSGKVCKFYVLCSTHTNTFNSLFSTYMYIATCTHKADHPICSVKCCIYQNCEKKS